MTRHIPHVLLRILYSLLAIAATTALLSLAQPWLSTPTVALLYLLPVGISAALWGLAAGIVAAVAAFLAFNFVFLIVGKWAEGGWVVLITFTLLFLIAHAILLSPSGSRQPEQIHRIVREKARVQGAMASIVEWQSLKMQEYRYELLLAIACFADLFGVRRPLRYGLPAVAGEYDEAVHADHPEAPSILALYLEPAPPTAAFPPRPD